MFEQNPTLGPGTGGVMSHSLEIIIMLLGAFILGFLLRHLWACCCACRQHKQQLGDLQAELDDCRARCNRLQAATPHPANVKAGFVSAPAPAPAQVKEDLKIVEGIGPKIEQLLNDAGIINFAQLAATSADQIKAILNAGGDRFKMHDPATWPRQAGLAAEGKMDELKKWQDELSGGK